MEYLPPPENADASEQEPITAERLREACLDLRLAIRKQVSKAQSGHRQRLQVWANRNTTSHLSAKEYIIKMAQDQRLPSAAKLRESLRKSHRVAAGTEFQDGHMVHHSYGIFEDETSARHRNNHPEFHLVITHLTKKINRLEGIIQMSPEAMEESETEMPLYAIDIVGESITVNQGARRLEADELNLPFDIITQARDLYVR